jgi:RNA polymerase sigma-70 factor (ECF subfamily)
MRRFALGDRTAFDDVFEALWPAMLQLTRRMLSSEADAQDAAQAALLKVFSRIVDYDVERDGLTWALTIAVYEAKTIARRMKRKREHAVDVTPDIVDSSPSAEQCIIDFEQRQVVAEIIGALAPDERALISPDPIVSDAPVGSLDAKTRKRKQRIIDRLRQVFKRTGDVQQGPAVRGYAKH